MKFDRNKKVDVLRYSTTQNEYGEQSQTTETYLSNIWASIVPSSGKEFFISEQMQAEITTKVEIQYVEGITSDMLVKYGNRQFIVMYVINPKEQNRDLILMCKEAE